MPPSKFDAAAKGAAPVAGLCEKALLDEATPGPDAGAFVWDEVMVGNGGDEGATLEALAAWLRSGGAFCAARRALLPPAPSPFPPDLESAVARGVGTLKSVVGGVRAAKLCCELEDEGN